MTQTPVTSTPVSLAIQGDIAVITIDNPPVNAGSRAVRAGLLDCIDRAGRSAGLAGVVLIGAGRSFIAGSDIREFGAPLSAPELPDVIAAVESCPLPVCAAIHGAALGGGFELTLGCDLRIAAPGAVLGLPEVTLGMVPGAGGTQRLPRLTGVAVAIDLVCSGRRVPASQALALGMVDALSATDAPDVMIATAADLLRARPGKRRLRDLPVPDCPAQEIDAAARTALKRGRNRPNVAQAIDLVRLSAQAPAAQTLPQERQVFQDLRLGDEAFALRHLFFAERAAARIDGLDAAALPIRRVGVVGGGTMGQGIVRAALAAGFAVTLVERDAASRDRAIAAIDVALTRQANNGRLTAADRQARLDRLHPGADLADLAPADLVIEAVFEDMQVKIDLFTALDGILGPDAILASNTSYLDIDRMAAATARADRVVGLHFFSPADVMPLLEVVRTARASDRTLATALAFARKLGKQPVVARVAEGFIGNRIYAAYRRHAEFLVEDGATPEQVDAAMTGFGLAMGPFAVADMSGLDIAWAMRKRQAATRDPAVRYCQIPDLLCQAGRLGRKTAGGWYDHIDGRAVASGAVADIIAQHRQAIGTTAQQFTAPLIEDRLLGAMLREAARLLAEGVAQRPGDIDVTLVHGYGFPRWTGGLLWWAAGQSPDRIAAMLAAVAGAEGARDAQDQDRVQALLEPLRLARSPGKGA